MTSALSKAEGLSYQTVQEIAARYQINRAGVRQLLGISESTQFRYEKNNPILKPILADRWARFERILRQAEDLFEDPWETHRWLTTPKTALSGTTPLEALARDAGSRQVEQMLTRAEYGIFS